MRKTKTLWLVVVGAILIAIVAIGVFLRGRQPSYKVGLVYPATGENARLGESVRHAAELAQDRANETFFLHSPEKLKLLYRDTQGRPTVAHDQFLALADLEKVPVVVGSLLSSDTQSFMKDADSKKVVVLANGSSDPNIRKVVGSPRNYVLRNWPSDDAEGLNMADYAWTVLKLKNGYSFVADDPYARGLANAFQKRFLVLGGQLSLEKYPKGQSDFGILVEKAARSKPDFFYVVGFPAELGRLVAEIRSRLGTSIPILSAVGIDSAEFFQVAGVYAQNIFYTSPYVNPGSPEYLNFQESYKRRFKEDPDITAAVTYDAVMITAQAIANSGYTSDQINNYLHKLVDYPGVSGLTTFNEFGDVIKPVSIKTIEHGTSHLLEVFRSPMEHND